MSTDSINDDILRIKRELATACGDDVHQIAREARLRQGKVIALPARHYNPDLTETVMPPKTRAFETISTTAGE